MPEWKPELKMPRDRRWFSPPLYGFPTYGDLFTSRQLVALTTFSDLVGEATERVRHDAAAAGLPDDGRPLRDGGAGAAAYAEAVALYLAFAQSKACIGDGDYGVAETLSKAKNTSVAGMVEAGIVRSRGGSVRLLRPRELPPDWDPEIDARRTVWETVHHLVRVLEIGGELAAAVLVRKLGDRGEAARDLCYRLYALCERKKRPAEALAYNGLVQSWPEIGRLAGARSTEQGALFDESPEEAS